jgi:3-methyladenine DNA glycosylase/8-oxoguanine DNA glycosylase
VAFLAVPEPFDFALSTERFRAFGPDRANLWHEGGLLRAAGGRELRIEAAAGGVDVQPLDAGTEPVARALLGLAFDLDSFYAWAAADEVLAELVSRLAGFRPPLTPDPFEMLVGAIVSQQVSLFSALAIRNRLIERFGVQVGEVWAFPVRDRLAQAREEDLLALGFSRRKAEYVVGLARAELDLAALTALPDAEVKARLTALRGLGEWSADWFLARHLARPHAWPWGDLALRKAVADLYRGLDVREAGARFHPFENLTAHYLLLSQRVP